MEEGSKNLVPSFVLAVLASLVAAVIWAVLSYFSETSFFDTSLIYALAFCLFYGIVFFFFKNLKDSNYTPQEGTTAVKSVTVYHANLNTPALIAQAHRCVVLHAAFYPAYAADENYRTAIRTYLSGNPGAILYVVLTDILNQNISWGDEFAYSLREEYGTKEDLYTQGIVPSARFFETEASRYPGRIRILYTNQLPFEPIVMIDDSLLVGHYAHSFVKAPVGLWMHLHHEGLADMLTDALANRSSDYFINLFAEGSGEVRALGRYIEELYLAIVTASSTRTKINMNKGEPL